MRILVTGASGSLGRFLVERLLADNGIGGDSAPIQQLVLMARHTDRFPRGPKIRAIKGDIRDAIAREQALEGGVDVVFHFAASLAADAERDFDEGWDINIDASFALIEQLRRQAKPVRLVYPSSIGIFGDALHQPVNDDTLPRPNISYGAAKFINEILISDLTRRGDLDGVSLRLSACLPRDRRPDLTPSPDFASSVFHALAAGDAFKMPVTPAAAMWFSSTTQFLDSVLLAARIPGDAYGSRRAFMLPALHLTIAELVEALVTELGPSTRNLVSWHPQPGVEETFAQFPPLTTPFADALGFRHDGTAQNLVQRTLKLITGGSHGQLT
jgi:nucleoside-diphosphate-sugar epimerase